MIACRAFAIVAIAASSIACLPNAPARTDEPQLHHTTAGEIYGPYVARGTVFIVHLDAALTPDGSFRARLDEPLRSPDGMVLVRSGALLEGHVVRAPSANATFVRVKDLVVRTMAGDVPISVAWLGEDAPALARSSPRVLVAAPAPAGSRMVLMLTEPFVPAGSSYR